MDLSLAGKTAVVTGGSGGIGRGLVGCLAREGCRVVVATRDEVKGSEVAEEASGGAGEAILVPTDVTDREAVANMLAEAEARLGPVDILVNNAGGTPGPAGFTEASLENIQAEIDLNVWGVIHCTRAVLPGMVERASGSIIQITSNSGLQGEAANQVATYGGTKGYVTAFSRALAYEYGPSGVRINCIAPGWIVPWDPAHTGEGSFWNRYGYEFFGEPDAMEAAAQTGKLFNIDSQRIRRIGRPEDIGNLACYLASDLAGYVTGQTISVGGGAYMP
ncbi:MAG: SDR family NAD(P)-dependent oxidoreductase [Myxococcota bacterium]|nr:SDR family NAD(P)-dependent oxidoreductase [Myxococcota bacterium]